MAHRNEIEIGDNPELNNMTLFRKVANTPFEPVYVFDDSDNLTMASHIKVSYVEYYKNTDGDIIPELTEDKFYTVPNIEGWTAANDWFLSLARTPITAPYGIMDQIESTLASFPIDVPNGYVLQQP